MGRWKRYAWIGMTLLGALGLSGCVERRYIVRSNPSGGLLYVNGSYLGPTPQDGYIVYYGKYNFVVAKDGYETLNIVQKYPAPWYELPGLDFIAENIVPFKIRDVRLFEYTLQPAQTFGHAEVLQRAIDLRGRGKTIGTKPPEPERVIVPAPATGSPLPGPALEPAAPNGAAPMPRTVPPPGPLATISTPVAQASPSIATVTPGATAMATITSPGSRPAAPLATVQQAPPRLATISVAPASPQGNVATVSPAPAGPASLGTVMPAASPSSVGTISPAAPGQGSLATVAPAASPGSLGAVTPTVPQPGAPGVGTITPSPAPAGR